MAMSSEYSQDPAKPGTARKRRYLRVAAVVAVPVVSALVLSACSASGQDADQMISLHEGGSGSSATAGAGSVTPVDSPTPNAVSTVKAKPAAATARHSRKRHQKPAPTGAGSGTGTGGGAGTTAGTTTAGGTPPSAPGWKTDFFDGFSGSSLNTGKWGVYNGKPSNASVSTWSSSMVSVSGGALHLRSALVGGKWLTAGLSNAKAGTWTYGKWTFRYRVQKAAGVAYVILLYPRSGWPPEYDIVEDGDGGNRTETMSTLHWGSSNTQEHAYMKADFSQYVTVTETSSPGVTTIALNGKTEVTIHNSAGVPSVPMWMGLQTQVNRCSSGSVCTNSSTPSSSALDVDYISHQSYVG
jgi:hypothetical protein